MGATQPTRDAIFADIDGDGRPDIVTALVTGETTVFRQTGPRAFADPVVYKLPNLYEYKLAAADLNEDGAIDLVAADGYGEIGLLLSGAGGFQASIIPSNAAGSSSLQSVAIADLDGDGHLDIAAPDYDNSTLEILWATGPATFLAGVALAAGKEPEQVHVIDANEDGLPDLVLPCVGGPSQLFINKGGRSFTTSAFYNTFSAESMATGDLNNDGHVDLVMADVTLKEVIVLLGDGHGGFSAPTGLITATQTNPASAALGDFDHDGNLDLALGHIDDPRILIYFGTGDGHFRTGQPTAIPITWTAINLTAGDLDGDGYDDLVATDWAKGATAVFGPCP